MLLYILGGDRGLASLLNGKDVVASAMVRMEAMVYHGHDQDHLGQVKAFLDRCEVVEIHRSVQDLAVELRLRHKLKLPDAVIAATAAHLGLPLLTADKAFAKLKPAFEVVMYGR